MKKALALRFCLLPLLLLIGAAHLSAADAPPPGEEALVQITPDLPHANGFYHYDFRQPITPGERLHIMVHAVAGVEIKTQIVVSTVEPKRPKGKPFERSGAALSQDWTMQKKPPGDEVLVRIRANALGQIRVRVDKVAD